MIGISACLGGLICRYDGQQKAVPALKKLVDHGLSRSDGWIAHTETSRRNCRWEWYGCLAWPR